MEKAENNLVKTTSKTGKTLYTEHFSSAEYAHKEYLSIIETAKHLLSGTVTHVYRYRWNQLMCKRTVIGEG